MDSPHGAKNEMFLLKATMMMDINVSLGITTQPTVTS